MACGTCSTKAGESTGLSPATVGVAHNGNPNDAVGESPAYRVQRYLALGAGCGDYGTAKTFWKAAYYQIKANPAVGKMGYYLSEGRGYEPGTPVVDRAMGSVMLRLESADGTASLTMPAEALPNQEFIAIAKRGEAYFPSGEPQSVPPLPDDAHIEIGNRLAVMDIPLAWPKIMPWNDIHAAVATIVARSLGEEPDWEEESMHFLEAGDHIEHFYRLAGREAELTTGGDSEVVEWPNDEGAGEFGRVDAVKRTRRKQADKRRKGQWKQKAMPPDPTLNSARFGENTPRLLAQAVAEGMGIFINEDFDMPPKEAILRYVERNGGEDMALCLADNWDFVVQRFGGEFPTRGRTPQSTPKFTRFAESLGLTEWSDPQV
jgi:hypothetical protein